jgi:hypothetical protein
MLHLLVLSLLASHFSILQILFSTLSSFIANVLLLFHHSVLILIVHFQQTLSISNDDAHHTMIGIFFLSASLISNISNSDTSHLGSCLHFLCHIIQAKSKKGIEYSMLSIYDLSHSW